MKMNEAKRADDDSVLGLVQQVTEIGIDIRKLQSDKAECEHQIVRKLVREKRVECLSINYAALRRMYHD